MPQSLNAGPSITSQLVCVPGELGEMKANSSGLNADDYEAKLIEARIVTQPKPALWGVWTCRGSRAG
jgi:hypothetical protein